MIEKNYDGADREIKTIKYADLLDIDNVEQLSTNQITEAIHNQLDSTKADITYHWYDKSSRECLTVMPNGLPIEKIYRAGQLVKEIKHFNRLSDPNTSLTESLESVLAKIPSHPRDRTTHYVRDELGRIIFKVTPSGQVTKQDFDKNSNVIQICKFKNPFIVPDDYNAMVAAFKQLQPIEGVDTITTKKYDKRDQLIKVSSVVKNHEDKVVTTEEVFERDALQNVRKYIDRGNHIWQYQYDRALCLTHEISPETKITNVEKIDGKLVAKTILSTVTKKTEFDKNRNAEKITDGIVDCAKEIAPRVFKTLYDANKQLVGTEVTATIDDGSNYSEAWKNLAVIPQKESRVATNILRDARDKKIAEQNEDGKWSFYIRDSRGRVVYEIKNEKAAIKHTYNALDQVIEERHYAMPCEFDAAKFIKTGIALSQVNLNTPAPDTVYIKESEEDRITKFTYNHSGKVETVQSAAVYFYSDGVAGKANPVTKQQYNIFDDVIYEAKLIRPDVWAEKFTWPDKNGKPLAQINEGKFVTLYERDGSGNELTHTEFYTPLTIDASEIKSLEDLKNAITFSPKDIKYVSEHETLNHKTSERIYVRKEMTDEFIDPITQINSFEEINGVQIPKIEDRRLPVQKKWGYTATEKLCKTIHEDGSEEYKFYEPRGILIGESQVARTSKNSKGEVSHLTPFSVLGLNQFGQVAASREVVVKDLAKQLKQSSALEYDWEDVSLEGENKLLSFALETPYDFLQEKIQESSNDDYEKLVLHDARGLSSLEQNRWGHQSANTWLPSKRIARKLKTATTLAVSSDGSNDVQHIDEERYAYDDLGHENFYSVSRDGVAEETTHTKTNLFGELVGQGEDGKTWPLYQDVDTQGKVWRDNASGVDTIKLFDLRGFETLKLKASDANLNNVKHDEIFSLLDQDANKILRTETTFDRAGFVSNTKFPRWFKNKNDKPSRAYKHDRKGNLTEQIDSFGNGTNFDYDFRNNLIQQVQPKIKYIKKDEVITYEEGRPITKFGYNLVVLILGKLMRIIIRKHTFLMKLDN